MYAAEETSEEAVEESLCYDTSFSSSDPKPGHGPCGSQ